MNLYQASAMNLLQSELVEHQKILDAFAPLPKALKKHIQSFYKSSVPITICPACHKMAFRVLVCQGECFLCEHNYFLIR